MMKRDSVRYQTREKARVFVGKLGFLGQAFLVDGLNQGWQNKVNLVCGYGTTIKPALAASSKQSSGPELGISSSLS
jgi:hypothetical protein